MYIFAFNTVYNSSLLLCNKSIFFLGENATITCKVESVPRSRIRWYSMEGSTEVLNNSITNRGQQR